MQQSITAFDAEKKFDDYVDQFDKFDKIDIDEAGS